MSRPRVSTPVDKRDWHPGLIPGPIALISTMDSEGAPNVAPKSWIQMVSFEPSILMFSGSRDGQTERNIMATECFAVNLVDGSLARRTFTCIHWKGAERIERSRFRLTEATKIEAPLVDDSRAHLECRLHDTREVGSGFVVFGEIVAAPVLEEIASAEPRARYAALDQALFLEDGLYATVERARPAEPEELSEHTTRYVYFLTHAGAGLLWLCGALSAPVTAAIAGGVLLVPFLSEKGYRFDNLFLGGVLHGHMSPLSPAARADRTRA